MDYNKAALALHSKYPGKIAVQSLAPCKDRDALSTAYTPGVAEPCRKIKANPDDVYTYTMKGRTVAVVTNGTAVLGLGNIGPEAGLTGVIAGLCTWVGDRLRRFGADFRALTTVGVQATLTALFTAPLYGFVAPLSGSADGLDEQGRETELASHRQLTRELYSAASPTSQGGEAAPRRFPRQLRERTRPLP